MYGCILTETSRKVMEVLKLVHENSRIRWKDWTKKDFSCSSIKTHIRKCIYLYTLIFIYESTSHP